MGFPPEIKKAALGGAARKQKESTPADFR